MERFVRKATAEDLPVILDLIDSGRRIMRENGNPHQWGDSHPTVAQIEDDIANGCSYVLMEDGRAIATFAFIPGPDVTYAVIYDGQWIDTDRPYYVLHRVASALGQHGIMTSILDYCLTKTCNIRIDTHRDNLPMQKVITGSGFRYCGVITVEDGTERLAYQKTE